MLYASVALGHETGFDVLQQAVQNFLATLSIQQSAPTWSMQFQHTGSSAAAGVRDHILLVDDPGFELALEDHVVEEVRSMWQKITSEDSDAFMKFDAREGNEDEDIIE